MSERYRLTFRSKAAAEGRPLTLDAEGKPIYTADDLVILNPISAILAHPHLYTRQHGLLGAIRFLDQQAAREILGDLRAHHLFQSGLIHGIGHVVHAQGWFLFLDFFQEHTGASLHERVERSSRTDSDQEVAELISQLAFDFYGQKHVWDSRELDINLLVLGHPQVFTLSGSFPETLSFLQGYQGGGTAGHAPQWVQQWWNFEHWVEGKNHHQAFREYARGLLEQYGGSGALRELMGEYRAFQEVKPAEEENSGP